MNPLLHTEATPEQPSGRPSAGQMLRAAREAQGLHLAVLSVNLKVSVRQLEALEADQYDAFKGATFVRALAQSVCRQLKIDPAPVLAALPQHQAPHMLEPVALASREAQARPGPRAPLAARGKGVSRQVLLLALLMLVGAAALIWWPSPLSGTLPSDEPQDPTQAAVPLGQASDPLEVTLAAEPLEASAAMPTSSPASAAPAASSPAVPKAPASVPVAAASAALNAARPVVSAAVPASATAATAASAPSSAPVAASESALALHLVADAWVEVRDKQGQMVVKRMVKAGESLRLNLPAPVFVYVGRADSAELSWQGKPVDLKPHTQNNEARLQLKP